MYTRQNIERAAKEINSARPLRAYVDTLLKQVIEDLSNQYNTVNEAFRRRIEETKEAKTKLEIQHSEVFILFAHYMTSCKHDKAHNCLCLISTMHCACEIVPTWCLSY